MKITEAGIVKRIEFPNWMARQRYLDNLRIDGKAFYIVADGCIGNYGGEITPYIVIVEPWRNARLMRNVTTE